jgi:hypothetical protein
MNKQQRQQLLAFQQKGVKLFIKLATNGFEITESLRLDLVPNRSIKMYIGPGLDTELISVEKPQILVETQQGLLPLYDRGILALVPNFTLDGYWYAHYFSPVKKGDIVTRLIGNCVTNIYHILGIISPSKSSYAEKDSEFNQWLRSLDFNIIKTVKVEANNFPEENKYIYLDGDTLFINNVHNSQLIKITPLNYSK